MYGRAMLLFLQRYCSHSGRPGTCVLHSLLFFCWPPMQPRLQLVVAEAAIGRNSRSSAFSGRTKSARGEKMRLR